MKIRQLQKYIYKNNKWQDVPEADALRLWWHRKIGIYKEVEVGDDYLEKQDKIEARKLQMKIKKHQAHKERVTLKKTK